VNDVLSWGAAHQRYLAKQTSLVSEVDRFAREMYRQYARPQTVPYQAILTIFNLTNQHWILVWMSMENKKVFIYDSLQTYSDAIAGIAPFYRDIVGPAWTKALDKKIDETDAKLRAPWIAHRDAFVKNPNWEFILEKVHQQTNASDCGVYVYAYLRTLLRGEPIGSMPLLNADIERQNMAVSIFAALRNSSRSGTPQRDWYWTELPGVAFSFPLPAR